MSNQKYEFKGKSIECETWEQMLHLAKLAEEQGNIKTGCFDKETFISGCFYFTIIERNKYIIVSEVFDPILVAYSDFINGLPNEVLEVTWCGDCPFRLAIENLADRCNNPQYPKDKMYADFKICPLKQQSLTIKLKSNDTTTSNA